MSAVSKRGQRSLLAAVLAVALVPLVAVPSSSVSAASIVVTTSSDAIAADGGCSLREAITAANSNSPSNECAAGSGADQITFSADTTILLGSRLPIITSNMTIDGSGFAVVIDGQTTTGNDGTAILLANSAGVLTLSNLTVARGRSATCAIGTDLCGAVQNYGTLTVNNSTLSNSEGNGFTNGIAITNRGGGQAAINNSTVANNRGQSSGAIFNADAGTTLTINNSTFSGNTAGGAGAIYNVFGATTTITNSTFVDHGGDSTLKNAGGSPPVVLANTIVTATSGGPACLAITPFSANSFNFDDDGSCDLATTSASLDLQPLADNGGPTETMALGSSSDAIDGGDDTVCSAAPINNLDQRGVTRPLGASCDAGAYEAAPVVPPGPPPPVDYVVQTGAAGTVAESNDVAIDGLGNVVVAGRFDGTVDFDPGAGVTDLTSAGDRDGFVYKLDAAGDLVWARVVASGVGTELAESVDVDDAGNVYVFGVFQGTTDFDPGPGVVSETTGINPRNFLVKLDAAGDFVWVRTFTRTNTLAGTNHVAVSGAGEAHVAGTYFGTVDLDPGAGVFNVGPGIGDNTFIVKLDSAGDFVWGESVGRALPWALAVDEAGGVYAAGSFSVTLTIGGDTLVPSGSGDGWIAKYTALGAPEYTGAIGGADVGGSDRIRALSPDATGNSLAIGGEFFGTADLDPGPGVSNSTATFATGGAFVATLDGAGNLVTVFPANGPDGLGITGVGLDGDGNVSYTGFFDNGAVLGQIDAAGNVVWSGLFGDGAGQDYPISLTVDAVGNTYIVGLFDGTVDFDPDPVDVSNSTAAGLQDGFLLKLGTEGAPTPSELSNFSFDVADDSGTPGATQVGVGSVAITDIPIESIVGSSGASYEAAPLGSIPLGSIPLGSIDLEASPLGSIPLGSIPLGSIPLGSIPLGSIPLGSIPLGSIGGWGAVLAGTDFEGKPLQTVTLGDVLALDPAPAGLSAVTLADIAVEDSPLGSISLPSIALGDQNLLAIDPTLCDDPALSSFDCTDQATDSLIELQIASAPLGSIPLGSIPLGSIPLGSIPLGSIPLGSIPLGSIPLGSIPLGSIPLGSIDLLGAPLGSIPLGSIPLGSIPLGSIDLNAAPLGSIPLGSIPLGSIPLGSIPLGSIGDFGGCAALAPSSVDCDALGLTDTSSATDFVAALPAGMTLASFIAELPTGTTISDTPLGSIPLGSIPLGSIPLGSIPLGSIPLGSIGLDAASLARSPLGSIPLGSIPLGSIPLGSIGDVGDCAAISPSAVDCDALGLTDASSIVDYVAALPVDMTMNEFLAALPAGTPIDASPLGSIPLGSIPLGSIPLGSIDLQSVEINGAPLGSIPLGSIGLNGTGVAASPLGSIPLGSIDVDATPLGSIPLGSIPLGSIPLGSIPLGSIPLGSIPLGSIPLGSIPLGSIPLGSIPLGSIPLGSINTVVNCALVDCQTDTLADAAAAGAVLPGATLSELDEYGSTTLGQLGEYGSSTLGELGEYGDATLGELSEYGDTTLGDIESYGPGIFGNMTLGALDALLTMDLLYGDGALGDAGNDYGDLTFGQILISMMLQSDFPWETLPLADLGLQEIAPTGTVTYSTTFDISGNTVAVPVEIAASIPDDFYVVPGSAELATDGAAAPIDDAALTAPVSGEQQLTFGLELDGGFSYEVTFDAVPGFSTGTTTTSADLNTAVSVVGATSDAATIAVSEYFTGNNDFASATDIGDNALVFSHTSTPRTSDYFRFEPGPTGTRHVVFVSQFDVDSDLVLYKPATEQISQVADRLAPLGSIPIDDDGVDFGGAITQEPALQGDIDLQPAPIGSISINDGTTPERAESTSTSAPLSPSDPYVIQVSGYQGEASGSPYVVRVKKEQALTVPACPATSFPQAAASGIDLASLPLDLNTLFLFNYERTAHQYGVAAADSIQASLDALILDGANGVVGAVLPLENEASIQAAYASWDAEPCDSDRANRVVGAITDVVDQIRSIRPTVGYVTIIGNDDMVPFARIDDVTSIANESTFTEQFSDGALFGALATRHFLSDDPYGDIDPITWLDRRLYLPEIALGRLVEAPTDITDALDRFVTFDGQLDPQTAAVAGYDFLADGTTVILDRLTNIYGAAFVDSLIDASGLEAASTWTLADLLDFLDLSDPTPGSDTADIISINAHSDQFRQLPSFGDANQDESDLFTVDDLGPLPADSLAGDIIFTMGCHSGLSVSDIGVSTPNSRDWAQAYSEQGALYAANSGYGYGDTVSVALSERLMAEFAENLDGGMTAGQAMAFAKQEYFAQLGQYGPYDEKSMQQVIFYGLPMYSVGATPPPEPSAALPTALYPRLDLQAATISVSPAYDVVDTPGVGTYYSIDGKTQNTHFRPIQPLDTIDISQDPTTLLAHGAIVTEATTTDIGGFDPVYFRPAITGATEREPEVPGDAIATEIFDLNVATYNGLGVGPNGEPFTQRQQATLIAGSFQSPQDGSELGIERLIDTAEVVVVYADPSSTDFESPYIASVDSSLVSNQVSFTVTTDAADVAGAIVLYRQDAAGAVSNWVSTPLVADGTGTSFSGGGPVDPSAIIDDGVDFKVWLVDTSGNVSSSDDKNVLWKATPPPPTVVPAGLTLDVPPVPTSGWYPGDVSISFVGVPDVAYTVLGAGGTPQMIVGSGTIVVSGDGVHPVTVEGGGASAHLTILIDSAIPTVGGLSVLDASVIPFEAIQPFDYECADAGAGIGLGGCTAEIGLSPLTLGMGSALDAGDLIDTSTPGSYDVIITATDDLANQSATTVTFTVDDPPPPADFLPEIVLIDAPTVPQLITDGVFIDIEFDDENGAADDYTVIIDWGNLDANETPGSADTCTATSTTPTAGNPGCEIVAEPSGTGTADGVVTAEFVYPNPGVYAVTVTIEDSAGNVATDVYEFVVVYDPGAGRVSGAGIYWSGPEAYDGSSWGAPARFGYNARYRGSNPEPGGKTKLRLFGEFFFKSTAYDYLIVNDTIAVAEGVGKMNGQAGYRFRVQGIDNGWLDFFQITIWDEATDEVIYDNGVLYDTGDLVLWGGLRVKS